MRSLRLALTGDFIASIRDEDEGVRSVLGIVSCRLTRFFLSTRLQLDALIIAVKSKRYESPE